MPFGPTSATRLRGASSSSSVIPDRVWGEGASASLALAADLRVASEKASFLMAFVKIRGVTCVELPGGPRTPLRSGTSRANRSAGSETPYAARVGSRFPWLW